VRRSGRRVFERGEAPVRARRIPFALGRCVLGGAASDLARFDVVGVALAGTGGARAPPTRL
jgi:hypothetical protein